MIWLLQKVMFQFQHTISFVCLFVLSFLLTSKNLFVEQIWTFLMGKWLLWRIRWKQRLVVQSLTIKLSAIFELHYFLDYLYFDYEDVRWRGKLKSFKYFSIIRTEAILIIYLRPALSEFRNQYPTLDSPPTKKKNEKISSIYPC